MQRIDSWQQYLDLKAEAKARGLTLSNLYFLPGQARQKIDAGRLYCRRDLAGAGWLLLDENGGFYRCYYQLAPQTPCAPVQLDRDAVIELPFRAGSGPAQQPELEQIARMGFALGRESARMERPAAGLPDSPPDPPGVTVGPAQPDWQAEIAALLDASFDRLYSFLPDGAELAGRIAAGQVLAAVGQDGRLLGVLNSSCGHNTACIDQLAVWPDARGRRPGAQLRPLGGPAQRARAGALPQVRLPVDAQARQRVCAAAARNPFVPGGARPCRNMTRHPTNPIRSD